MLIGFELRKIWRNKIFLTALIILVCANLFLLWTQGSPTTERKGIDAAYRKLGGEISVMTREEKEQYLDSHYKLIRAMVTIEALQQQTASMGTASTAKQREANQELYDMYFDIYKAGNFLRYLPDIAKEYSFLHSVTLEFDQVCKYDEFLQETEYKAQSFGDISIFANSGGFNDKNLKETAADFAKMQDVIPDFFPQRGLYTAIDFSLTDLIILVIMLFMAFSLIRGEIDTGSLLYVRTMPSGRFATALGKLAAIAVSTLFVTVLLFGSNLLFCSATYGLGNLSAPIQSYYFLMRSTLKCNLLEYICLFMLTKWVAVLIIGVWVLLACMLTRRAGMGYLLGIAFPLGCELLRQWVSATSSYNMLRYANIASLAQTNEILGNYRNLNILGTPVHLFTVEALAATCYLLLFSGWFCARFCLWQVQPIRSVQKIRQKDKFRNAAGLYAQEAYKTMILCGGALVLTAFFAVQILFVYNAESFITPDEVYYRYYIGEMQGQLTQEKVEWIKEQGEDTVPRTV